MPVPTTLESLSTTAASNGPAGSEQRTLADDGLRQAYAFIRQTVTLGSNIASASSITPPSTGSSFNITGTTTITAIASTNSWDGRIVALIFAGALTLTHSSNLALPGAVNIATAANDVALFIQTASGAWRCISYQVAAGGPLSTSPILGPAGTVSIPGFGFAGDANNGWWAPAADVQAWALAGAEAMRLNSTGLGVGITPVTRLHILATSDEVGRFASGAANSPFVSLYQTTTRRAYFVYNNASSGVDLVNEAGGGDLNFGTQSVLKWTVQAVGHLIPALDATYNIGGTGAEVLTGVFRTIQRASSGALEIHASNAAGTVRLSTAGVDRFDITADGRVYGTALHNNAGAVTGTTNQYIASGTYTPTLTNMSNVSASTTRSCQWVRTGNVVAVSGRVTVTMTASVTTNFRLTLPITSTLVATENLAGTGVDFAASGAKNPCLIFANTANAQAEFNFSASDTPSQDVFFSFMYVVL